MNKANYLVGLTGLCFFLWVCYFYLCNEDGIALGQMAIKSYHVRLISYDSCICAESGKILSPAHLPTCCLNDESLTEHDIRPGLESEKRIAPILIPENPTPPIRLPSLILLKYFGTIEMWELIDSSHYT